MSDPVSAGAQSEPHATDASGSAARDAAPAAPAARDAAPAARRYSAPDLDAPRYVVPAYAAPEPGEAAPVTGAPLRYAAPQGYVLPASAVGAVPDATDSTLAPPARPAGARAPGFPAPPGYSGTPGSPVTPGYSSAPGYSGAPGDGGAPGYPGAPGWPPNQAGALSAAPGARAERPKTLSIIALLLAAAGVLLAFVPYVAGSFGLGWLSFLFLFAAFVLSIVALASRNQGGKGIGVGALITSIVGEVLTLVLAVAWVFAPFGSSDGDAESGGEDGYHDDFVTPGLAAPGTDGQPDPGVEFAPPVEPTLAEAAFGHEYEDVWWYVVVVDNPNADYVFDAYVEVRAATEDGSTVAPSSAFATLLTGQTAIVGYFFGVGGTRITRIDVSLPRASDATLSPADETGAFTVDGITAASTDPGAVVATGTLSGRFAEDQRYVTITALARSADGAIVAAATSMAENVPGDGTPVPFEVWFSELPADATLQAFAHR
ncbi:hypothetical protein ACWKWN_15490 [Microbacterium trichothecenolyticum]